MNSKIKLTVASKALFLLILLGFIWGSGYSLAKFAMNNGVPSLGYAFWQSAGPAFLLSLSCYFKRQTHFWQRSYWPYYLICGFLGIAIPNTNMYFIANYLPAGLLATIVNTVPLLVYPLALLTKQEKFDAWRVATIILGLLGILLIIMPSNDGLFSYWTLLALVSPLAFALCSIFIGAFQPKAMDSLSAASGMLIAATLLLLPLVLQQKTFYSLMPPFNLAQLVVLLEIGLSTLGYFLFFQLIRLAGPVFYSLTGSVVCLTGLFWGFIIFHEIPNSRQSIAIGCIITSLFLLSWRQTQQSASLSINHTKEDYA